MTCRNDCYFDTYESKQQLYTFNTCCFEVDTDVLEKQVCPIDLTWLYLSMSGSKIKNAILPILI
jgi:hypothetical protein